jgi:hypothetical protein
MVDSGGPLASGFAGQAGILKSQLPNLKQIPILQIPFAGHSHCRKTAEWTI